MSNQLNAMGNTLTKVDNDIMAIHKRVDTLEKKTNALMDLTYRNFSAIDLFMKDGVKQYTEIEIFDALEESSKRYNEQFDELQEHMTKKKNAFNSKN